MREIRFRAWDSKLKIIRNVHHLEWPMSGGDWLLATTSEIDTGGEYWVGQISPRKDILMQFTGLKDRNGNPIYEGDIVHRKYRTFSSDPYKDEYAVVEWKEEVTGFCGNGTTPIYFYLQNPSPYTLVGNIWENPELLKK